MAPTLPPVFPTTLQPLAGEIHTFFRELPRLLDDGHGGRFAVVKGDAVHGVWDTQRDAIQYGRSTFADGLFLAQRIDRRLADELGRYFPVPTPEAVAEVA